uniref:dentin sialophosphoprotein-like isoform X2 n=1 Tax=Styela clava TaxID=7725 RepID=UPI00193AA606|nr:dentin sialophosphoprotein-like isoform X2 [Styela clava]
MRRKCKKKARFEVIPISNKAKWERVFVSRKRTLMQKCFEIEKAIGCSVTLTIRTKQGEIWYYASHDKLRQFLSNGKLIDAKSIRVTGNTLDQNLLTGQNMKNAHIDEDENGWEQPPQCATEEDFDGSDSSNGTVIKDSGCHVPKCNGSGIKRPTASTTTCKTTKKNNHAIPVSNRKKKPIQKKYFKASGKSSGNLQKKVPNIAESCTSPSIILETHKNRKHNQTKNKPSTKVDSTKRNKSSLGLRGSGEYVFDYSSSDDDIGLTKKQSSVNSSSNIKVVSTTSSDDSSSSSDGSHVEPDQIDSHIGSAKKPSSLNSSSNIKDVSITSSDDSSSTSDGSDAEPDQTNSHIESAKKPSLLNSSSNIKDVSTISSDESSSTSDESDVEPDQTKNHIGPTKKQSVVNSSANTQVVSVTSSDSSSSSSDGSDIEPHQTNTQNKSHYVKQTFTTITTVKSDCDSSNNTQHTMDQSADLSCHRGPSDKSPSNANTTTGKIKGKNHVPKISTPKHPYTKRKRLYTDPVSITEQQKISESPKQLPSTGILNGNNDFDRNLKRDERTCDPKKLKKTAGDKGSVLYPISPNSSNTIRPHSKKVYRNDSSKKQKFKSLVNSDPSTDVLVEVKNDLERNYSIHGLTTSDKTASNNFGRCSHDRFNESTNIKSSDALGTLKNQNEEEGPMPKKVPKKYNNQHGNQEKSCSGITKSPNRDNDKVKSKSVYNNSFSDRLAPAKESFIKTSPRQKVKTERNKYDFLETAGKNLPPFPKAETFSRKKLNTSSKRNQKHDSDYHQQPTQNETEKPIPENISKKYNNQHGSPRKSFSRFYKPPIFRDKLNSESVYSNPCDDRSIPAEESSVKTAPQRKVKTERNEYDFFESAGKNLTSFPKVKPKSTKKIYPSTRWNRNFDSNCYQQPTTRSGNNSIPNAKRNVANFRKRSHSDTFKSNNNGTYGYCAKIPKKNNFVDNRVKVPKKSNFVGNRAKVSKNNKFVDNHAKIPKKNNSVYYREYYRKQEVDGPIRTTNKYWDTSYGGYDNTSYNKFSDQNWYTVREFSESKLCGQRFKKMTCSQEKDWGGYGTQYSNTNYLANRNSRQNKESFYSSSRFNQPLRYR